MKPALLPVRNVVPSISAMVRPQPSPSAVTERDRTNISEPAPLRRPAGEREGPAPKAWEGEVACRWRAWLPRHHPPHPTLSPRQRVERDEIYMRAIRIDCYPGDTNP